MKKPTAVTAALLALLSASAHAGVYERLGEDLARAALRNGKQRLAILPFQGMDGTVSASGRIVAERLTGQVSSAGRIEVVERVLLRELIEEARLEHLGLVDPASAQDLGRVLGVDALVTGTVLTLKDGRLEINARMIDAASARVISAATAKVEKDWNDSPFADFSPWGVEAPPLAGFGPEAPASGFGSLRERPGPPRPWARPTPAPPSGLLAAALVADAPMPGIAGLAFAAAPCERISGKADVLERSMMDLKARYWALKLRDKRFSVESLTSNPGSEIQDPDTRTRFYSRLRMYYEAGDAQPLAPDELASLARHQEAVKRLSSGCPPQVSQH